MNTAPEMKSTKLSKIKIQRMIQTFELLIKDFDPHDPENSDLMRSIANTLHFEVKSAKSNLNEIIRLLDKGM